MSVLELPDYINDVYYIELLLRLNTKMVYKDASYTSKIKKNVENSGFMVNMYFTGKHIYMKKML